MNRGRKMRERVTKNHTEEDCGVSLKEREFCRTHTEEECGVSLREGF